MRALVFLLAGALAAVASAADFRIFVAPYTMYKLKVGGMLDLALVVRALRDIGYTGPCEIEYEKDFDDNYAALCENVGYLKGLSAAIK